MCVEIKINLLIISILVIGGKNVVKNLDIFKDIFFNNGVYFEENF